MYKADRKTIRDRREQLRVKIISLMLEAKLIRREESRTFGQLREELRVHRTTDVRHEARCSHIAYGLIRGMNLNKIERPRNEYDAELKKRVAKLIAKYGPPSWSSEKVVIPAELALPEAEPKPITAQSSDGARLKTLA